jgi:hypothetical protein
MVNNALVVSRLCSCRQTQFLLADSYLATPTALHGDIHRPMNVGKLKICRIPEKKRNMEENYGKERG